LAAYSNYGACLAGYIVERVTGIPWERYLETRIFAPLGMSRTTARQPLSASLAPTMAVGYRFDEGEFHPEDWEILGTAPAGAVSATAGDMARFMIAHLDDGRLGPSRILSDSIARLMHARAFGAGGGAPGLRARLRRDVEPRRSNHRPRGRHPVVPHRSLPRPRRSHRRIRLVQHRHRRGSRVRPLPPDLARSLLPDAGAAG